MLRTILKWGALALGAGGLAACGSSNGLAFSGGEDDGGGDSGSCDLDCSEGGGDATLEASSDSGRDSGVAGDGGGGDSGGPPPSVLFVHAAKGLPDLRFCWAPGDGSSTAVRPFPFASPAPESNYPATPVGGAALLADAAALAAESFTLYALDAQAIVAAERSLGMTLECPALLGGDVKVGGLPERSFWALPPLPAVSARATVIAITGCPSGDPDASVSACGSGWTRSGNLSALEVPLVAAGSVGAGQLGMQAAQLSTQVAAALGDAGQATVTFGAEDASTGASAILSDLGSLAPQGSVLTVDAGLSPPYDQVGFRVSVPKAGGGTTQLWMSLEESLEIIAPTQNPAVYYAQPTTYALAVVGDPAEPSAYGPNAVAKADGTQLHLLMVALPVP